MFGWSPKCGCTHVIKLFNFLTNNVNKPIHTKDDVNELPQNLHQFKIIIFVRNPYERIISGFMDKYSQRGQFNHLWNQRIPLTFNNFTIALSRRNFNMVDAHHFYPQLSCGWSDVLKTHENLTVYDISKIDYACLEQMFNAKIPPHVIAFRGGHEYKTNSVTENVETNEEVYNLLISQYEHSKPATHFFYDEAILKRVEHFYKKDFDYFNQIGLNYVITQLPH